MALGILVGSAGQGLRWAVRSELTTGSSSELATVEECPGGFRRPLQLCGAHREPSERGSIFFSSLLSDTTPTQEKEAPFVRCCGHFLFRRLQPIFHFAECGGRQPLLAGVRVAESGVVSKGPLAPLPASGTFSDPDLDP